MTTRRGGEKARLDAAEVQGIHKGCPYIRTPRVVKGADRDAADVKGTHQGCPYNCGDRICSVEAEAGFIPAEALGGLGG